MAAAADGAVPTSSQVENHLKTGGEARECQGKSQAGSVSDDCFQRFQEFKIRRKHRYVIYKIDAESEQIVPEAFAPRKTTGLEDFKNALPFNECRYCVYEYEYTTHDGRPTDKMFFLTWMPNNATPYNKMAYAQAKPVIRQLLDGVIDASVSAIDQIEQAFGISEEEEEEEAGDPEDW